jgi:oxysterol-binding protein 1
VNYGKGWRSRWFVLEDGVLSYYKLRGGGGGDASATSKASPAAARVIGEGDALRRALEAAGKQWKPFGEIHLKVRW